MLVGKLAPTALDALVKLRLLLPYSAWGALMASTYLPAQ